MNGPAAAYLVPLFIAPCLCLGVGLYAWRRRATPGAVPLALLMLAVAWWGACYALQLLSGPDLPAQIEWNRLRQFGVVSVAPLLLTFVLQYTGRDRLLTRRLQIALWLPSVVFLLLALTNEVHGRYWTGFDLDQSGAFAMLVISRGVINKVFNIFTYVLISVATLLFLYWGFANSHRLYRRQMFMLALSLFAPWAGNALFLAGLSRLELTSFAFTLTGLGLAWALFHYRLLDLEPIARSRVIEEMSDGMFVLDPQGRLVDLNPAARRLLDAPAASSHIGQPAAQVFRRWPDLVERFWDVDETQTEITVGDGAAARYFDLRISPLPDQRRRPAGRLIVVRDITDRKQAEEEIRELNATLEGRIRERTTQLETEINERKRVSAQQATQFAVTRILAESAALEVAGPLLLKAMCEELGWEFGELWQVNPAVPQLELTSMWERTRPQPGTPAGASHVTVLPKGTGVAGRVWASGEPVWIPDIVAEMIFRPDSAAPQKGLRSACAFPIRVGHAVTGVLTFFTHSLRPLDDALLDMMADLGGQIGQFLARKRAEAHLLRLYGELEQRVRDRTSQLQESEARFRQIVENAGDLIYRTDTQGRYIYANPTALRSMGFAVEADVLGKHYLTTVAPAWKHKVKRFYERQFVAREPNTYYEFMALAADGREVWLGQNVQLLQEGQRVIGFQAVARDITERKQAEAALQEQTRRLALLNAITQAGLEMGNVRSMLQAFANRLSELFYADGACIAQWDEARGWTNPSAGYGTMPDGYPGLQGQAGELTMAASVLNAGRALVAEDVLDTPYISKRIATQLPTRSMLGLPLIAGGQKLGAALIGFNQPRTFTPAEIAHGEQAAAQVALALARAKLLDALQVELAERKLHERRQTARQMVMQILAETTTLSQVTPRILEAICESLGWDLGEFWGTDRAANALKCVEIWRDRPGLPIDQHVEFVQTMTLAPGEGLAGWIWANGQTAWVGNVETDGRFANPLPTVQAGLRCATGFPLGERGQGPGVMCFYSRNVRPPDPALLELFAEVGRQIGQFAERRWAEESLRESEARLQAIIDNAPLHIFLKSAADGRYILGNRQWKGAHGLPTQLRGETDAELFPEQAGEFQRTDAIVIETQQPYTSEEAYLLPDGRFRTYLLTEFPLFNADGALYAIGGIAADITERKRAEEHQAQLLRQLEDANRELDQFAHVVSHDLKAPLRAIGSLADWLAADYAGNLDQAGQAQLALLKQRVRRMHDLIEGILNYARLGPAGADQAEADVALGLLVADVIETLAPPAHITLIVAPDLPTVQGNPIRLRQVFQNLIGNAIKFMDKPQGQICIKGVERPDEWEFHVTDNGPGIEAKYFEKIFQLFQTLRARDEFESTGVGLAVVKKIVEAAGGRIWVESTVSEGSTFAFTWPKRSYARS